MHYDDRSRRITLLGGLFAGVALGLGLTLLLAPPRRVRVGKRKLGRGAKRLRRAARRTPGGARQRAAGVGRMAVRRFRL
jgi:hypothetical protein